MDRSPKLFTTGYYNSTFNYSQYFSMIKVKTLSGDDLWTIKKKDAVIESLITALYQDEKEQAEKYRMKDGIDWEGYYNAKADAGFTNKKRWKFLDSREVFVQIDSLWLKPELGLNEERISWSLRVDGFLFHGTKVNVQLYAGSDHAINLQAKAKFKDSNDLSTHAPLLKWTEQILEKFEPLGHGTNFQAKLDVEGSNLVQLLIQKLGFNLKYFTVLWTSHDFLFLIMHERENFVG